MFRLNALLLAGLIGVSFVPVRALAAPARKGTKTTGKKAPDRPADQKSATKGLEEALKKTEVEEEVRAVPVARPDDSKAVSKDALADQRRDDAIEQIKKILPNQTNPEVRADLLFRLAENWWEKSRYVKIAEEMPAFDREIEAWHLCVRQKGEKACSAEPRPNHRKSDLYRKNAIDLYSQVIKDYPRYGRVDEIRFILALNKAEMASQTEGKAKTALEKEAVEQYGALIRLHPDSEFVSDAYIELGNYYFQQNDLNRARKSFDEAAKLGKPKTYTYAVYKLAWCDLNSGAYHDAVRRLQEVVDLAEKGDDRIRLKDEAMRDLVVVFSRVDAMEDAIRYFQEHAGNQGSREYVQKLANTYFDTGKNEMSIKMYRYMIANYKNAPRSPEWQSKIVLAYGQLNQRQNLLDEMRVLVNDYRPGSAWYVANSSSKSAIDLAYSLTEEALYGLVTDYHKEAISTKSVATYRLARDIYGEYVDNFPTSERAYQMRFYYAEILYALEEFQAAHDQYVLVAVDKERDDLRRPSASNMLLAAEKLVDIEAGRYRPQITDASTKIDESKDKGIIDRRQIARIDKDASEQPLTDLETQLVASCDRYAELVPDAQDEARVRLRAAVIYFDRYQYVPAAERFGYIINKWPEEGTSAKAALLILESLEVKEEWITLNKLSREFNLNKRLLAGSGKEELKTKLPVYIEGSQFKIASAVNDEEKDYPKAARMFREFVDEFPKSKFAPIGLAKAFYIQQDAKRLDTAIETGERMLAEYKDADSDFWRKLPNDTVRAPILPDLRFALAKTYEQVADFGAAAVRYERFAADFPKDYRALDAQLNAGLWYQGLGEGAKAVASFEKYIKLFEAMKAPERAQVEEQLKTSLVPVATVVYSIALVHEGQKEWEKARRKFADYVAQYPREAKWKLLNAQYRQILALQHMGKEADALRIAKEIVEQRDRELSADDRKQPTTALALAHSRFLTLEPKFDTYAKVRFASPATLAQDLKRKTDLAGELSRDYTRVVEDGNGDYAIAALVRVAMLPRLFAKSLLDAPMPKGLDEEQQELYRATLEEKAFDYEEPAVSALETALATSFEKGIYNEWTLKAEELLAEFKPDLFQEVRPISLRGSELFFTAPAPTCGAPASGAGGD